MGNAAKFFGVGHVINDPKTASSKNGLTILNFPIACFTTTKDEKEGRYVNDIYNVVAFGQLAERTAQILQKGSDVTVSGDLKQEKYQTKDGNTGMSIKVQASEITVHGGTKKAYTRANTSSNNYSGDNEFLP